MSWSELYNQSIEPTMENINEYIKVDFFDKLCSNLESKYTVVPKIEYSKCSMQKGWNIKYKKSSKSLCTIYPMEGYFIALVVIGAKEQIDAEEVIPTCSEYVQDLFWKTPSSLGGKWLMIEVRDSNILDDVLRLIDIRCKGKKKK